MPVLFEGRDTDQCDAQGLPKRREVDLQTVPSGLLSRWRRFRLPHRSPRMPRANSGRCTMRRLPTARGSPGRQSPGWAKDIGLDMKRFTADLDSDLIRKAVLRDQADGDKAGVEGTPTVFLNGRHKCRPGARRHQAGDRRRVKTPVGEEVGRPPGLSVSSPLHVHLGYAGDDRWRTPPSIRRGSNWDGDAYAAARIRYPLHSPSSSECDAPGRNPPPAHSVDLRHCVP